uniref:UDP-N-acetylglucosamine--N-acetylmuramyl-(pentapeptide) pyrophosphoryl-undecaprenol N-acetylglucosamine transferase n=1 Tax=Mesoaciditoga lauensis TaxID=1495039 RepID=A0A7V3VSZ8_9BACT
MPTQTEIRGIFAAGVTGGHIYPAQAVADELAKRKKLTALFIGTGRGAESKIFKNFKYEYKMLPAIGSDASRIKYLYKNFAAFLKASSLIKAFNPDFIFTTGGYVGGIVGYAAHRKGIPVFLHESNIDAGISVKKLASYASLSFCAFEKTAKSLNNGVFVGTPVRDGFDLNRDEEFSKKFPGKKILAFGGSEGSEKIDGIVSELSKSFKEFTFFHIGPTKIDYPSVINYEYFEDIPYLMRNCDIVISRAGASTIAEIIQSSKPAIIVPWKGALNSHQESNANYLSEIGGAFVVDEDDINFDQIKQMILKFLDPAFYSATVEHLKQMRPKDKPSIFIAEKILTLTEKR